MHYSNKDIRRIVEQAVARGWKECERHKHGKLRSPDGKHTVAFSLSPSDPHAYKNLARDLVKVEKGVYR